MPVILTEHDKPLWMDQDAPPDLMEAFAASTAVNSPGRDAPEMLEPVAG